jgi:uncharacterized protein (TIGR02217 family)
MSSFFEVEFPRTISYNSTGGSGFNTTTNEGLSGFEQRNKNWATSRGQWQIDLTTPAAFEGRRQTFLDLLDAFFLVVSGMGDAFRLFDHVDNKAVGSFIGTGSSTDGGATGTFAFQLQKVYAIGGRTYIRSISKPITSAVMDYQGNALPDTVVLYDNGIVVSPSIYSVDATTGIVTFHAGHAPANTHIITADFQFHYPVRFDMDLMQLQIEESDVKDGSPIGTWASVALKEVRIAIGGSQG